MKLPAARKTLSSTLVIHPLHQVWNHPETLVSCLIQPVVLMIMWKKLQKYYQLYSIGEIRKYLDKPATEKMIYSAMTSRLDYCNSLLYGINGYLVSHLQRCQINAARIVSLRRKYDHITPVLKDLHWLPVEYRINYKILFLAYKVQHGMAPPHLSSLLSPNKPGRSQRSEGKHLLTTPRYHLEGFGKRCFVHAASSFWNTLFISIKYAQSIDIFKSNLKTHLFNIAYSWLRRDISIILCVFSQLQSGVCLIS